MVWPFFQLANCFRCTLKGSGAESTGSDGHGHRNPIPRCNDLSGGDGNDHPAIQSDRFIADQPEAGDQGFDLQSSQTASHTNRHLHPHR